MTGSNRSENKKAGGRRNPATGERKQKDGSRPGAERKRPEGGRTAGRKAGRCPVSGRCGGCRMIDVPYKEQLAARQKLVKELIGPYCPVESIIGMERPDHYRNKVHAVFTHDRQGKPLSGVYKEGTHEVVPVEECLLEDEKADAIIAAIRGLLPSFKIKTYDEDTGYGLLRHVLIRTGRSSGQILVTLVTASPVFPSKNHFVKALRAAHPEITTIVQNINDRNTSMVLGEREQALYGKGYIEDTLCGRTFRISSRSFYQVNSVQTEKLYRLAIDLAGLTGKETVLDAYCGIGTIGLIACGRAARVIGVELNRDAVRDAVANARLNQIKNIEFYQKDAGEFMVQLAGQGERIDTVFLDPPRTGSSPEFLNSLCKLRPGRVVYISCNPETLARDLKALTQTGVYRAVKAVPVDMFPYAQVKHVETAVLLVRKP